MNISLGNLEFTIRSGALVPLLLMLPNVVWMALPKVDGGEQVSEPLVLTIVEHVLRAAVLMLPFFYALDPKKPCGTLGAIGAALALALYYAGWIRYFAGGQTAALMQAPLLGIPLPLAVTPVAFLVLSSYLMGSWWMLGASVLFGIVHLWVSALSL